ncbi:MAG: aldehyde ferredoxin oxidoreductase N-terminal domain-containing protein [Thermodesulfobacteriota bacterium]|nr:aldehyde ferredoxin oxidoreductase N-terminal domain-containing protein [Thermodesulfobacteriota bacterium]
MNHSKGYAGKILKIDLSTGKIQKVPTENYTDLFVGGRGLGCKIYWDEVPPQVDAFDPLNRIVFVTGPLCGVHGFAGARWQVCSKSPLHNRFSYCNLGGSWGVQLKFAGYDALVVHGHADKPVYIHIDENSVEIRDAKHLWTKGAIETREALKKELGTPFRIVSIGPAGENKVTFSIIMADNDATGGSGLGAVMGSKNLKAIAVHGDGKVNVAEPERTKELKKQISQLTSGMSLLLPTAFDTSKVTKDSCYGCTHKCIRNIFHGKSGKKGKFMCQAALFYQTRAQRFYGENNEVPFEAAKLCDDYGIDTHPVETMIMWLSRCHKTGIVSEQETRLPLSRIGSMEFIEKLVKDISLRNGFGDLLANGTHKAAEKLGKPAMDLIKDYITKTGYNPVYGARMFITTGLFYAMEPRLPIQQLHEISILGMIWAAQATGYAENYLTSQVFRAIAKRFWGSEAAADFSTYDGKALAAAKIQDRQYAKESLILCDFIWPITHTEVSTDHVGDPTLESKIYSAVTGIDMDEEGLYKIGERVFNLQRAILIREGHKGREDDTLEEFNFTTPLKGDFMNEECLLPGKDGKPFSRKSAVIDREQFEKMKDDYYSIRGWDVSTGLQKLEKLKDINLGDAGDDLGTIVHGY